MQEANAPPPSTRCSAPPSSTVSIRRSISTTFLNASPTNPSARSTNCSHGTCRSQHGQHPHSLCVHTTLCGYISYDRPHRNGSDHTLTLIATIVHDHIQLMVAVNCNTNYSEYDARHRGPADLKRLNCTCCATQGFIFSRLVLTASLPVSPGRGSMPALRMTSSASTGQICSCTK
jgi:hypothetical protein